MPGHTRLLKPARPAAAVSVLLLMVAGMPAAAASYEVGPGRPYSRLAQVPWTALQDGDQVLVHWRPEPYREKILLAAGGVTLRGVPGPGGALPVIDGNGASTPACFTGWTGERGVVQIGNADYEPAGVPTGIVVENLEIRSGRPPYTFTSAGGVTRTYPRNAASLYVRRGGRITIRGCTLRDSGIGLMIGSSDRSVSHDILVEANHILDNGIQGSTYEHNSYTAARNIVFQYNRYGPLRGGARGCNLKDRSAGLVVRYNWIEGGNRQLDLVDAEDSAILRADPAYRITRVYGNTLIEPEADGNPQMVHYGGDSQHADWYRRGVLLFYHNTVVSARTDHTVLFRLQTADAGCDARNNIFFSRPGSQGFRTVEGPAPCHLEHNGLDDGPDPGFVDAARQDYRLAAGSACLGAGGELHPLAEPVLRQYVPHQSGAARTPRNPADLGAYPR